ncbi:MAG: ferritin-like domain-containing protein [Caldilineaceae bacterium]|nr:ferritin-like domain-containing protein [Caldilineaceae bacterium]
MKEKDMQLNTMKDLYVDQLRDLYSAEDQLTKALPKMAQAASSSDLQKAFRDHLNETQQQKQRLEQIFSTLGMSPQGETCEAMKGLIKEGEEIINTHADSQVKDAALIAAAQRVEHYEMAGYGTVRTFADELGYNDAKDLLQTTLDEEGSANKKLTSLAEGGLFSSGINQKAMAR